MANLVLASHFRNTHPASCIYVIDGLTHIRNVSTCGGIAPFDFYPFVLLNLLFSVEAAYATPIILFAQRLNSDERRASVIRDRAVEMERAEEVSFIARELSEIRLKLSSALTKDFTATVLKEFSGSQAKPVVR